MYKDSNEAINAISNVMEYAEEQLNAIVSKCPEEVQPNIINIIMQAMQSRIDAHIEATNPKSNLILPN